MLKKICDRMVTDGCDLFNRVGPENMRKNILLMTARGNDYSVAMDFYGIPEKYPGLENPGTGPGAGKEAEAKAIGSKIQ